MNPLEPNVRNASSLVCKGLQPGLSPTNDTSYRELLSLYEANQTFRQMVQSVATGLELMTLSVSHKGAIFAPESKASRFALRLQDVKLGMSAEEKALIVLIHVTIAALFYPTAEKLNDDRDPPPVSEADTLAALKAVCQNLAGRALSKGQGLPKELEPGWQCVLAKPESRPESQRRTFGTLEGLISTVFKNLRENGAVRLDSDEGSPRYTATWRYTVQLRELAVSVLFEAGRAALAEWEEKNA